MHIEELSAKTGNKYVTVTLSYEETRDIANGLHIAAKEKPEYEEIKNKCLTLFQLVKDGWVFPTKKDLSKTNTGE